MTTRRPHPSVLARTAAALLAALFVSAACAELVPTVTKPALFDVVHRTFASREPVKPGETAAALLRVAQIGCPANDNLARLDPSRLRYALLGGDWMTRRTSEKSVLSDAAQWQVRTFMANVESEAGAMVEGLNLRVDGLDCAAGASEVEWLSSQVATLDAAHLKRGKARLAQYGIAELPASKPVAVKAPPKPESAKQRIQAYFPEFLKAKEGGAGRFIYAAEALERSLAARAGGTMLDTEVADLFCRQWGQSLRALERISRGTSPEFVEYGALYACDGEVRGGRDEAVTDLAASYTQQQASIEAGMLGRNKFGATLRFGSLGREQAHTFVRWAFQTGLAQSAANCGSGMYVTLKSLDFWLTTGESSRDAVISIETQCNRRPR